MNLVMEFRPGTISHVICGLTTVHAVGFVVLWRWSKRDYRSQYRLLEDFTSGSVSPQPARRSPTASTFLRSVVTT